MVHEAALLARHGVRDREGFPAPVAELWEAGGGEAETQGEVVAERGIGAYILF